MASMRARKMSATLCVTSAGLRGSAVKKTTGNPHPKLTIPPQLHHAE
jgi:hypothetical protein